MVFQREAASSNNTQLCANFPSDPGSGHAPTRPDPRLMLAPRRRASQSEIALWRLGGAASIARTDNESGSSPLAGATLALPTRCTQPACCCALWVFFSRPLQMQCKGWQTLSKEQEVWKKTFVNFFFPFSFSFLFIDLPFVFTITSRPGTWDGVAAAAGPA